MANLSQDEINALKAAIHTGNYVFVDRQQTQPEYIAGGQRIAKPLLESLRIKGLVKRDGKNYKYTPEGNTEAQAL